MQTENVLAKSGRKLLLKINAQTVSMMQAAQKSITITKVFLRYSPISILITSLEIDNGLPKLNMQCHHIFRTQYKIQPTGLSDILH